MPIDGLDDALGQGGNQAALGVLKIFPVGKIKLLQHGGVCFLRGWLSVFWRIAVSQLHGWRVR